MPRILHISCDYPDDIDSDKTAAVANLVRYSGDFQHTVVSLNRSSSPPGDPWFMERDDLFSVKWFGLPYGIGLRTCLERTAHRLTDLLGHSEARPDLVHSHKLTFEGIVGQRLAEAFGVPHVCTFRGDTDLKLIRYKPSYRPLYRSILQLSAAVFFLAPWTRSALQGIWPDRTRQLDVLLPNIVDLDFSRGTPATTSSSTFVSIFHLKDHRRKNVAMLLRAFDQCVTDGFDIHLDIIGGGSQEEVDLLQQRIRALGAPERVRCLGARSRDDIVARLPSYAGLLLPSRRETFGMVYLEALHAGIPFLHSANAGVDGYFDQAQVSLSVDPGSVASIRDGIRFLFESQDQLKSNIRGLVASGGLERFDRDRIVETYQRTVADVLRSRSPVECAR